MAEPNPRETKELVELFAKGYNDYHSTNFQWDDTKSYQADKHNGPYDFILFDGARELGVQLTRAVESEERDFIRPKKAEQVIKPFLERLRKSGLSNLYVSLNLSEQPDKKEADKLAYRLFCIVQEKVRYAPDRLSYFNYDSQFDEQLIPKIKKYVSDLEILPSPDTKGVVIGWSHHKTIPEPLFDDEQRVTAAVQKKHDRYRDSNILILVDAFNSPVFDFYIPLIEDSLKSIDVNEVWIVENFASQRRVIKVK